ncbi:OB-fold domain-containing protein [Leptolyngbya sp. 15MV]|nr:OB-fold domain-containing protein [Leptolyngbya sp. 15MV]
MAAALADAGVVMADLAHLVLASPLRGMAKAVAGRIGFAGQVADPLDAEVGYCGAAHPLMMLVDTLARARPGERIALVGFGQGVDVLVFEATEAIARPRAGRGIAGAVADALVTQDYLRMLSFYDRIALEWGMRGEKTGKAALTEHHRSSDQLDSFTAGVCRACDTVQFPVLAYCVNPGCGAPAAQFAPRSLADETARIFTITSDWLSYHPAPPLAVGFVQFDFGARLLMEVVDAAPDQIVEGQELRMVFRIKERDRARGYNRYFWKATPVARGDKADG